MNGRKCLQCGTINVGSDCGTCDGAGRTEALAMAGILILIALALGVFAVLRLL